MGYSHDVRYAIRLTIKKPVFALSVILTLGVCMGAVTAVVSVVNATLLRPLPFPEPDRLLQMVIHRTYAGREELQDSQDGATWQQVSRSLVSADLAIYSGSLRQLNFTSLGHAGYIRQQRVGAGYFGVLGLPPALGREFSAAEDVPNGPFVAVLGYRFWQKIFNSDRAVVGKTITVAGVPYQVVGIASRDLPAGADIFTPLRPSTQGEGQGINYLIIGRLRPNVPFFQAETELISTGQTLLQNRRLRPGLALQYGWISLQKAATSAVERPLWLILSAALLVLVVGCVNIAGMLLARGVSRHPEIATRMAIGAGRGTIVRQLLTESLLMAVAGGIFGLAIGSVTLHFLKSILPAAFLSLQSATLDLRVLLIVSGISILTSLVFGVFPAIQAGRTDLRSAQTGRSIAGSSRSLTRRALLIAQIAIAVAIFTGAGLLVRTFRYLHNLEPGFDAVNVITANFALLDARYNSNASAMAYFDNVLQRLKQIPGVENAAVSQSLPFERALNTVFTRPNDSGNESARLTNVSYVTPEFFRVFRIPVLRGRDFQEDDSSGAPAVIVVNAAFARLYFNAVDPIGQVVNIGGNDRSVIGVVGDVLQQAGWGDFGPLDKVPASYIPAAQSGNFGLRAVSPSWVIRTAAKNASLQEQIENSVTAVDPALPLAQFRSMSEIQSRALEQQRFMAILLSIASSLALLLAAIGTWAMIANSIAERTRELAIRLALGSTSGHAIRAAAMPGLMCATVGLGLGLILARIGSRLVESMVYGVTAADSVTYTTVGVTVLLVVAAASLLPALRILRMDPSQTLRLG